MLLFLDGNKLIGETEENLKEGDIFSVDYCQMILKKIFEAKKFINNKEYSKIGYVTIPDWI